MIFVALLAGLMLFGANTVSGEFNSCSDPLRVDLQGRQLHSLTQIDPSKTTVISSAAKTTLSSSSTVSTKPESHPVTTLHTTTATGTKTTRWALTTTFTQPSDCASGISQYPDPSLGFWNNIISPVPSLTLTLCYPDIFLASASATVETPPFEQLICPYNWEAYNYNETYIICCPSDYGIYVPNWTKDKQRPGKGAWCTSYVDAGLYTDYTIYNKAGQTLIAGTTVASSTFILVQATAFDGIAASPVPTSTTSVPKTSTVSSTSTTSSKKSTSAATSSSSSSSSSSHTTAKVTTSSTSNKPATTKWTGPTAVSQLPSCGQTCFGNMLGQYKTLGCSTNDPACLCRNVNFGYGIRDCSNGACGASVGSSIIAFETEYYCPSATAARTTFPSAAPSPTAISELPPCGRTCFSNMMAQYSTLGCASPAASCLCKNINFGYGIRDCSNGACGAAVGSTVIAFESRYCASATAVH